MSDGTDRRSDAHHGGPSVAAPRDWRRGLGFGAIAGIAALGGLLFGYDTGVISGALVFITRDLHLSSWMQGVVASSALAGAVLGAAVAGSLSDAFGRRWVIFATGLVFVVGALVSALGGSLAVLLAGRVLVGAGIGVASMLAPLYLAETAPAARRGGLVSLNQLMVTVGILVSYLVGYALAAGGAWRWMLGLGAVPGAILAIGMLLVPESPRWLAARGRIEAAHAALVRLHGRAAARGELAELRRGDPGQGAHWRELLDPRVRAPMVVGVGLALLQQITGINTVIYYAPTIFRAAGLPSASVSILATAGVGVVNVAMTLVAIRLLDRTGRRVLLLGGLVGMALSLIALACAFLFGARGWLGWLASASLAVYVGSFAIGLGPVFWLLISEIFPLRVRGRAMAVATVANWGSNLLVTLTFPQMVQALGRPATFFVYAGFSVAAILFTHALVPETRGRSLEAIEAGWRGDPA